MIFQSNERKYQFFLFGLNDSEHVEMTNLITKNGGEICVQEKPPAIRFANCENYDGRDPVFHINYIRECDKHQQLLDLINFKIGAKGYYGCLMSLFVHGENMCSFVEDTDSCCSSIQIQPRKKCNGPIIGDHMYAQGDSTTVQGTSNFKPWLLQSPDFQPIEAPRVSEIMPAESSPDLTFLPDETQQNLELIPAESPRDSEFLPDGSPQHSGFIPDGAPPYSEVVPAPTPPDLEFLPDEEPQNTELIPAESPRDSEFLPDESPQHSGFIPDRAPPYSEVVPAPTPPDLEFLPDETPHNSELIPDEWPRDSEFLPDESLQHSGFIPDRAPPYSEVVPAPTPPDLEFLPDETPQNSELIPAEWPRDSEFLPDELPQHSGFIPDRAPPYSEVVPAPTPPDLKFLHDETTQNSELIPAEWPRDSEFLPDESRQHSGFIPDEAPPDSEFVRDPTPADSEFLPGESPENPRFLPDEVPQNLGFLHTGSVPDSEFLPDERTENPRFLPDEALQNSEFLLTGFSRHSEILLDGSRQNPECLPAVSPADSEFLPEESQSSIETIIIDRTEKRIPEAGQIEFALELPEPARFEELNYDSDTSRADQSPSDVITLCQNSRPMFCDTMTMIHMPLGEANDAELGANNVALPCLNVTELYSPSAAEEETEACNNELVSVEIDSAISLNARLERLRTSELKMNRAISPRFKSRELKRNLLTRNIGDKQPVAGRSKTASSPTILRYEPRVETDDEISLDTRLKRSPTIESQSSDRATSPMFKSRELKRKSATRNIVDEQPVAGGSKPVSSPIILTDESRIETDDETLLDARLERLGTIESKTSDRGTSPMFRLRVLKRKLPTNSMVVDEEPVAGGSKTSASPTILRDESNRIKILGGYEESFNCVKEFRLTSSDTDDPDHNPTVGISDPKRRRFMDGTSPLRIQDADGKKKVLKKRKKIISPLRDSDISEENEEVSEVSNTDRRGRSVDRTSSSRIQEEKKKVSTKRREIQSPLRDSDISEENEEVLEVSNTERRGRSVDQTSSSRIQEVKKKVSRKRRESQSPLRDSDISEEDGEVRTVSRNDRRTVRQSTSKRKLHNNDHTSTTSVNTSRATNNGRNTVLSSTRTSDAVVSINNRPAKPNPTVHTAQRDRPLSRNYLPWEQRQMVRYLIDNGLISEAKGNRVWKQMIDDGYLTHRTVLSLNNHFRKLILPTINRFKMEPQHMRKFKQL